MSTYFSLKNSLLPHIHYLLACSVKIIPDRLDCIQPRASNDNSWLTIPGISTSVLKLTREISNKKSISFSFFLRQLWQCEKILAVWMCLEREDDTLDICAAGYWPVCGLEHYYSLSFLTIFKVTREDTNSQ